AVTAEGRHRYVHEIRVQCFELLARVTQFCERGQADAVDEKGDVFPVDLMIRRRHDARAERFEKTYERAFAWHCDYGYEQVLQWLHAVTHSGTDSCTGSGMVWRKWQSSSAALSLPSQRRRVMTRCGRPVSASAARWRATCHASASSSSVSHSTTAWAATRLL